jgi:hypothetical protein
MVNRIAARIENSKAATTEEMKTVSAKAKRLRKGNPLNAIWSARNAYFPLVAEGTLE